MASPKSPKKLNRRTSPRTKGIRKCPAQSEALKRAWQDPVKAERMRIKKRGSRLGVPDGIRKKDVLPLWEKAKSLGRKFIELMEDHDLVEKTPIPGSEAEMAKAALEEAFVRAVGPMTDAKTRAQYLRLVLEFTKAKPESKTKLTLDKSEEWLAALEADMKNGSHSDTSSAA